MATCINQSLIPNPLCRISKSTRPISSNQFSSNFFHKDEIFLKIKQEALSDAKQEPILCNSYYELILSHKSLESSLSHLLSTKLSTLSLPQNIIMEIFYKILVEDSEIMESVRNDLEAAKNRDPACISYAHCFLNLKGFQALQAHRIAHKLWSQGRTVMALLIQNRVSEVFAIDIHPGAKIGKGIVIDHGTGVVIGETAVMGNDVTILHNVTLGGTGKVCGDRDRDKDRHPKIGDGVFLGAGAKVLGNVRIGDGAKIGAASLVLKEVPSRATAVGNPARLLH